MKLPDWATDALEEFRPVAAYREHAPDPQKLQQWHHVEARLKADWNDIDASRWCIPDGANRAMVSRAILECGLSCAKHYLGGKSPNAMSEGIQQLEATNEKIKDLAGQLAALFRERENLIESQLLNDCPQAVPDPFQLWDAMEVASHSHHSIGDAVRLARTSSQWTPAWSDILDLVASRDNANISPMMALDVADMESRKKVGWAPLARRLFALLDSGQYMTGVALRKCLNHRQMAALLRSIYGANDSAFNEEVIKALLHRYDTARTVQRTSQIEP